MVQFWMKKLIKPAMLGGAVLSLSACAYGGAYGDGYVNGAGYACDPYAPFDDYYACDSGYGYANIGFGGGWYDNFYYPGYGLYVFDRGGSRYAMQRNHRLHWARQRAEYGSRHAHRGDRDDRRNDWRNGDRGRDLTPAQRAERRERRGDLTPAQRADRRDRRSDRADRRATTPNQANDARTGRVGLRDGAIRGKRDSETRQNRRGNRQGTDARPQSAAQPAAQQRPEPVARTAPQPTSRPAQGNSRMEVLRRNAKKD
ncbi:MAG: hypothetical protein V7676_00680 [Parasphingorhabdus sp.]|uniref:hypothetical protein n=1 Tax=Parasphingorhabdus sp. TaxID=2709688 RepID=UPI0030032CEE